MLATQRVHIAQDSLGPRDNTELTFIVKCHACCRHACASVAMASKMPVVTFPHTLASLSTGSPRRPWLLSPMRHPLVLLSFSTGRKKPPCGAFRRSGTTTGVNLTHECLARFARGCHGHGGCSSARHLQGAQAIRLLLLLLLHFKEAAHEVHLDMLRMWVFKMLDGDAGGIIGMLYLELRIRSLHGWQEGCQSTQQRAWRWHRG